MQTQTESLAGRVQRPLQENREPLLSTGSTSATIAELVGRIETLELANQEVADGVGSLRRREQRRNEQTQGGRSAPPLSSPRPPTRARR